MGTRKSVAPAGSAQNYRLIASAIALAAISAVSPARAGQVATWDSPSDLGDTTNTIGKWVPSYQEGHTRSIVTAPGSVGITDGTGAMRIDAAGGFTVATELYVHQADPSTAALFTDMTTSTKIMVDVTSPTGFAADYTCFQLALNYGGQDDIYHFIRSGSAPPGPPGTAPFQICWNPITQTAPQTQTYTWDFAASMTQGYTAPIEPWAHLTNWFKIHINTNSGGANPAAAYILDNMRCVNEAPTRSNWNLAADGDWNSASTWSNGVIPNSVGAPAILGQLNSGTSSVQVNQSITVGSIIFDSPDTYHLNGNGTLNLDAASGNVEIYNIVGNHTIAVPINVVNDDLIVDTVAGNTDYTGNGGVTPVAPTTMNFAAPVALNGMTLTVKGAGTANFDGTVSGGAMSIRGGITTFGANQVVTGLSISPAAIAHVKPNGGTLINSGTIAISGLLDLSDNDMIVHASDYATVTGLIAAARNGGSWSGTSGITSSSAALATPKNRTLGTLTGAQYLAIGQTTFDGVAVAANDVLVKFTYYGDADLNGVVNFDDYARIDGGFNSSGSTWFTGDFDYNNLVNFDDYSLIDLSFNTQSGTLIRAMSYLDGSDRSANGMNVPSLEKVVDHFAQFGENYASSFLNAVPEPGSALALAGFAATAIRRRRR